MGDERVDERARRPARAGMHDEPGRLVDDDEGVVLKDDVEGNGLRRKRGLGGFRDGQREAIAWFDPICDVLYGRAARGGLV